MSHRHSDALAHLVYGVGEGGGFVQLTGEVGTGKTTLCRCLLEQLPENVDVALILNPRVTGQELIASLCDELQIDYPKDAATSKPIIDALNEYLLDAHSRGRRIVMIIDEAQNLETDALEQVRLLTNLETTTEKLLQIILIGQPELRDLLDRDDLRQLSQRITARYHLDPIDKSDTEAYINHRLQIVDGRAGTFTSEAVDYIRELSNGIPRIINVLCDRALLGAYVEGKRRVTLSVAKRAAAEVLPESVLLEPPNSRWWMTASAILLLIPILYWQKDRLLSFFDADKQRPVSAAVSEPISSFAAEGAAPADLSADSDFSDTGINRQSADELSETPVAVEIAENDEPAIPEMPDDVAVAGKLESLLADVSPTVNKYARAALFRRWGYASNAESEAAACVQAPRISLRCLRNSGSWQSMIRFDRPTILLLNGPEGSQVPILLEKLDGDKATIMVDEKRMVVTVRELQESWLGKYRLLWQPPPGGNTVLRPGDRNADVRWMRERLQSVLGEKAITANSNFFSFRVKQVLRDFQTLHGLDADAVAGPETIIFLNSTDTDNPDIPRLTAIVKEG